MYLAAAREPREGFITLIALFISGHMRVSLIRSEAITHIQPMDPELMYENGTTAFQNC